MQLVPHSPPPLPTSATPSDLLLLALRLHGHARSRQWPKWGGREGGGGHLFSTSPTAVSSNHLSLGYPSQREAIRGRGSVGSKRQHGKSSFSFFRPPLPPINVYWLAHVIREAIRGGGGENAEKSPVLPPPHVASSTLGGKGWDENLAPHLAW